jgi:hypothetical protein
MSKTVFLDNFQPILKNKLKLVNCHQPSYGTVSIECKTESGYFCKLNTGFYLYRHNSYVDFSPYGWSDFHKSITSKITTNQKEFTKLETFDLECRYLIGIHKSNLRPLFPTNNFTRELSTQEEKAFRLFVLDFSVKYEELFKQFKFEKELQTLYSELENFGTTV